MQVTHKDHYTVIEKDDIHVKAEITANKTDIEEIHIFVPALDSWVIFNCEKAHSRANELIEEYKKTSRDECPVEHNFKIFA